MKTLKRILAMTLAIMMVMGLSVAAFADGTADGTTYYCGKEAHTHSADCEPYVVVDTTEVTTPSAFNSTWNEETWNAVSAEKAVKIDDTTNYKVYVDVNFAKDGYEVCYECGKEVHTHDDACEVPPLGSITIGNPQTTTSGATTTPVEYKAYRIFDLSYEKTNAGGVPTPDAELPEVPNGEPYTYFLPIGSKWKDIVVTYATDDNKLVDHDNNDQTEKIQALGLILDPVYDKTGTQTGYDVTYDKYFDPAEFAEALKTFIETEDDKTGFDAKDYNGYSFANNKATGLPFGYYLVEPSTGALASLTSTDPDVVVSDKNEQPKVDKVIVEENTAAQKLYDLGTYTVGEGTNAKLVEGYYKYDAYEIFHKTDANVEWGRGVDAEKFSAALADDDDLAALFTSTYGVPAYTTDPGDTVSKKWIDLYTGKDGANIAQTKDDFIAAATGTDVLKTSTNALNPVNAESTYLVVMSKLKDNATDEYEVVGYDIITADADTGMLLTKESKNEFVSGEDKTEFVAPEELVNAELEGINNEVKANGASIGETVNFKLTTKVPDMTGYKDYFFVVNDQMDEGLTFDPASVKVYLNADKDENPVEAGDLLTPDTETVKTGDYYVVTQTTAKQVWKLDEVSGKYAWKKVQATDPATGELLYEKNADGSYKMEGDQKIPVYEQVTEIRIIFKNMLQWRDYDHDGKADTAAIDLQGEPITITYSATLNQKANVYTPEENNAVMEFSNDPSIDVEWDPEKPADPESYDPRDDQYKIVDGETSLADITGVGPKSTTYTYTAQINLTKVAGSSNTKLSGAKFVIKGETYQVVLFENEIFKKDAAGTWYLLKDGTYTQTVPNDKVEVTYVEYDGKIVTKVVAEDIDKPTVNYFYFNESAAEGDDPYVLITEENIGNVPTDAVMYKNEYTFGLYINTAAANAEPKYELVSAVATTNNQTEDAKLEELLEANPATTFYTQNTTTNEANYDVDAEGKPQKFVKVTELVQKENATNRANLQFEGYTDENGLLTFTGLGEGTYTIEELIAPDGYNLLNAPITVVIQFAEKTNPTTGEDYGEFSATVDEAKTETGESATTKYDAATNTISFNVVNNKGTELPETGGIGTYIFYALGGLIVAGAGVLLITRKRMSEDEE